MEPDTRDDDPARSRHTGATALSFPVAARLSDRAGLDGGRGDQGDQGDMSTEPATDVEADEALVARARSGDRAAYAELWSRHHRSAVRVARQFTSIDAYDLVSEAYARIYQRILAGGGPTGAFRPYLYTTVRNLASSWGGASHEVSVERIEDLEHPDAVADPAARALDRTLTTRAFKSLPERWQTVLWYTEVEGMDPHEVAPLLGLTANGVAALSYRAREGLRKGWLQAHVAHTGATDACAWTVARLGDYTRHGLSRRERAKVDEHLAGCASCAAACEEVDEVAAHLAPALILLVLGTVAGGGLLSVLAAPAAPATAGTAAAVTGAAASAGAGAAGAGVTGAGTAGAGAASMSAAAAGGTAVGVSAGVVSGPTALVGSLALVVVVSGGVIAGFAPTTGHGTAAPGVAAVAAEPPSSASTGSGGSSAQGAPEAHGRSDDGKAGRGSSGSGSPGMGTTTGRDGSSTAPAGASGATSSGTGSNDTGSSGTGSSGTGSSGTGSSGTGSGSTGSAPAPAPSDPANVPGLGGVVGGVVGDVGKIVDGAVGTVTGGSPPPGHTAPGGVIGVDLRGTGTPGAHLSLQAAGQVYATTTVGADGTFHLAVTALPRGLSSLELVQSVDKTYLLHSLGLGGLVGNLLGTVDALVQKLIQPLHLDALPGGVSIRLLTA